MSIIRLAGYLIAGLVLGLLAGTTRINKFQFLLAHAFYLRHRLAASANRAFASGSLTIEAMRSQYAAFCRQLSTCADITQTPEPPQFAPPFPRQR